MKFVMFSDVCIFAVKCERHLHSIAVTHLLNMVPGSRSGRDRSSNINT